MTNEIIYAPLPSKSQTIRLLHLRRGPWGAELKTRLRECTIDEARDRYTTISYTWGSIDTTRQVLIKCNGKRVAISENLYTILRRLRRPDATVVVWVDALCINQRDILERTHQVGLMSEIYKNSLETVIWLGEQAEADDVGERFLGTCISYNDWLDMKNGAPPRIAWQGDDTDQKFLGAYLYDCQQQSSLRSVNQPRDIFGAFCFIHNLAQGTSNRTLEILEENENKVWDINMKSQYWYKAITGDTRVKDSRSSRIWEGFARLMSRPWWTRIWVVQETVLSRKTTVRYGMLSAPWTMFADAALHYARERHSLCLDLSGKFRGDAILAKFSNAVLHLEHTRCQRQVVRGDIDLLSLLWKFRPFEASDKRDKVFALLGLVTNWQGDDPMLPDYKWDTGDTFLNTTISNIRRARSLTVLAGDLEAALSRKRLEGIASWVMDWSLPCTSGEAERVSSLNLYNASGGRTGSVRLHPRHSILEVPCRHIGEVVVVGDVSRHTQISDTCAVIRNWNLLTREYGDILSGTDGSYPTGGTYDEAFWRTLVGDMMQIGDPSKGHKASYRRACSEDADAFRAWRMWSRCISRDTINRTATFTQRDLDDGISAIHYALKTATTSRRFFITREGYIGIGPSTIKPADIICAFENSKVPFLVRLDEKQRNGNASVPKVWRTLIGKDGRYSDSRGPCHTCDDHVCHQMVGDCYVHGFMDGEAFEKPSRIRRRLYLV